MAELEKKIFNAKFEIKQDTISEDSNNWTFKGIISTTNLDNGGDIILPEAYNTTLKAVQNGHKVKVFWQHDRNEPLGVSNLLEFSAPNLISNYSLPKEDQFVASRVMPQVRIGSIDSLSIGAQIIDSYRENDIRYIKDMLIYEFSLVSIPMNSEAKIISYKSFEMNDLEIDTINIKEFEKELRQGAKFSRKAAAYITSLINKGNNMELEIKSISGSSSLPTDPRATWDGAGAKKRILAYAGGKDNFNTAKYGKGFVVVDGDKELLGSYHLPFADVIDGVLTATWGGVLNATRAVLGARGGYQGPNRKEAYDFLTKYYKKFDKEVPAFKDAMNLIELLKFDEEELDLKQSDSVDDIQSESEKSLEISESEELFLSIKANEILKNLTGLK